jgi:hypothetical protein
MIPEMMDIYNQALVAQNGVGIRARDRDDLLSALGAKARAIAVKPEVGTALTIHRLGGGPAEIEATFRRHIQPKLKELRDAQSLLLRDDSWPSPALKTPVLSVVSVLILDYQDIHDSNTTQFQS